MAKNLKSEQPSLTNYIALKEVKKTIAAKRTTNLGAPVVEVLFADGTKEEFPEHIYKKIVSTQSYELTELRDRICFSLAEDILALLLEAEIKISDLDALFQTIQVSLNKNIEKADEALWGKGVRERTLYDANKILKDGAKI